MPPPVFRFAPSPNGYLHLGHAYSALLNFDLARRAGGRFLLRIEDIDTTRCRPEFEAAIYEDLGWLGIAWETTGAAAVGASRRLSRGARAAFGAGPGLSEFREPRRDRTSGGAARGRWRLAARSRRRAALSRRGEIAFCRRARTVACNRARLMRCGSTWRRHARAPAISAGSSAVMAPTARPAKSPPGRKPGATSSWRARRRRPAIISRW